MPNLFIIRGLPGSGKSTLGTDMITRSTEPMFLFEADQFFTHVEPLPRVGDGTTYDVQYNFNRCYLGAAHDMCYGHVMNTLFKGMDAIVANTFSTVREIDRYITGARRAGVQMQAGWPKVIHCTGEYKSEHNVPDTAIERMRDRWEPYPGEVMYTGDK